MISWDVKSHAILEPTELGHSTHQVSILGTNWFLSHCQIVLLVSHYTLIILLTRNNIIIGDSHPRVENGWFRSFPSWFQEILRMMVTWRNDKHQRYQSIKEVKQTHAPQWNREKYIETCSKYVCHMKNKMLRTSKNHAYEKSIKKVSSSSCCFFVLLSTLPSKKNTLQIASSAGNVVAANVAPWPYDRRRNHRQEKRPLEALRSGRSWLMKKLEAKFIPSISGIFTYMNGGFFF